MTYVDCLQPGQLVCTHPYCLENTPLCLAPNPDGFRKCSLYLNHKGKHYVPPMSFNYEYWE